MLKHFSLFSSLLVFLIDPMICIPQNKPSLSECDILPLSLYTCKDNAGYGDIMLTLKSINDNGDKALDVSVTLNEPLTEEHMLFLQLDAFDNGQWKENIYSYQGGLCSYLLTYVRKGWTRMRETMVPPFESECEVEPGQYELKNYEATPDDLDMPAFLYGDFRLTLKASNSAGEVFFCRVLEVRVSPKPTY